MRRCAWFLGLCAAAMGCAAVQGPQRAPALELQALEGKVSDLEHRVAFEAGEKEALAAALERAETSLASCRLESEAAARRAGDFEKRLRQCEGLEEGGRAELDLCRRERAAVEEERDALRRDGEAAAARHEAEAQEVRREIEDCRGRLAGAEAQAVLAAAEKRKGALQAQEKVEEVTCSYDRLLDDVRASADGLRARVAELEASLASLEKEREAETEDARGALERLASLEASTREAEQAAARSAESVSRLREALAEALGAHSELALLADESRAAASAPFGSVFAPKTTDLRSSLRDGLRRVAGLAQAADLSVRLNLRAPASVPPELTKRYPTAWDLAAGYAARVARYLERDAGLAADRVTISSIRLVSSREEPEPAVEVELIPPAEAPEAPAPENAVPAEAPP